MNYPFELQKREAAAVRRRREVARQNPAGQEDPDRLPGEVVGVALSGGGIRSATFSLGILQALARKNRLRKVDYVCSISGGGYTGGFLGRLFMRESIARLRANHADPCQRVEEILSKDSSPPLGWVRANANYLLATGFSDVTQHIAMLWRNLFTIYFVLTLLSVTVFSLLVLAGGWVERVMGVPSLGKSLGPGTLSPWWWLPIAAFGLGALPLALAYWLAPKQDTRANFSFPPLAGWAVLLLLLAYVAGLPNGLLGAVTGVVVLIAAAIWLEFKRRALPRPVDPSIENSHVDAGTVIRDRLTRTLGDWTALFACTILWVILDTVAHILAGGHLIHFIIGWVAAITPLIPFLRAIASYLSSVADPRKGRSGNAALINLPHVIAAILAFLITALLIVLLDALAIRIFQYNFNWGLSVLLICASLTLIFGRAIDFLNYSSLQNAYASRICRTFLGASNPARLSVDPSARSIDINLIDPSDDIPFDKYHPEENGGPLHLIGLCVNETVDFASRRDDHDRKGLPMCVGPCGISVGRKYHATWSTPPPLEHREGWDPLDDFLDGRPLPPDDARIALRAIPVPGELFHVFLGRSLWPVCVERLNLSRWIGISGAAFGTGTGRTTSLPVSLLLGLANLRLGYWWNSGIDALNRPGSRLQGVASYLASALLTRIKMQSLLISDMIGRFTGPTRRFWNISDGGHFDGTGIYELIRRRIPFIIAFDGSEDPAFGFADAAELVEQVRVDFGAVIDFQDSATGIPGWIMNWFDPGQVGPLSSIGAKEISKHAVIASVTYPGETAAGTWILILKASLTGDEPLDIASYKLNHSLFPNEPTTDQFFNDTQWECYRALGAHIGDKVINNN